METQESINRLEWEDSRNWHFTPLGLYYGRRDRRLFVPKRFPAAGFTINLGHPWGTALAISVVGLLVLAIGLAVFGL